MTTYSSNRTGKRIENEAKTKHFRLRNQRKS